jgi:hypothetical protein
MERRQEQIIDEEHGLDRSSPPLKLCFPCKALMACGLRVVGVLVDVPM